MENEKTIKEQIFDIYKEANGQPVTKEELRKEIKARKIRTTDHNVGNVTNRLKTDGLIKSAGPRGSGFQWIEGAEFTGERKATTSAATSGDPVSRLLKQINHHLEALINVAAELPNHMVTEKERDELNKLREFKRRHDELVDYGKKVKVRPSLQS